MVHWKLILLEYVSGVEKLVLVHIGPHLSAHGPMEHGIGDISRIYNGEIIFSEELMRISL